MESRLRPRFCRVAFILESRRPIRLSAHQGPVAYALLSQAYGLARNLEPAMPDGFMPDAPEQCRLRLAPGELYALGCTLIRDEQDDSVPVVRALAEGLRRAGREKSMAGPAAALWGNFRLHEVWDLVTGRVWSDSQSPAPIAWARIDSEQKQLRSTRQLTLRFNSPLRMLRRAADRQEGHHWFDEEAFDTSLFAVRVMNRLAGLGLGAKPEDLGAVHRACRTIENRLVWLDLGYGPQSRRKTLGGAVGRVTLECRSVAVTDALVLGQYARVGQCTRMGFGAYRIEELGPDPYECWRGQPLLHSILQKTDFSKFADELDLPSGSMTHSVKQLLASDYQPQEHTRVPIDQPGGKVRVLSIPTPMDRALQRAMLVHLAPALDQFFEESSLAYRKGLGRKRAARRIRDAFRDGYRYALRSDFRQFFDTIDHRLLQDRLEAYLADDSTVDLIMRWVRAGAPFEDRGIPTGSPLSPLLANLFLDRFDEQVARDGGRLVRYADDFMILFKDLSQAQAVFQEAQSACESLLLSLNDDKTHRVDLRGGFEFLGFRFQKTDRWAITATQTPQRVEDLGWQQAAKQPQDPLPIPLPGETDLATPETRSWVVFGPGATSIRARDGQLLCGYREGTAETSAPLDQTREVLLLGYATLTASALVAFAERHIRVVLADDSGRPRGELAMHCVDTPPEAVAGQLAIAADPGWRLAIARRLVAAKIRNHGALASAVAGSADPAVGPGLIELALRAEGATSMEQLLGIEGSAARQWYRFFATRLPRWCRFERRVAPDAEDPANILLNLAQTVLHRQAVLAARLAGLIPALGILHELRPGHAALASDLQEPFRHLMERVVLQVLPTLKPSDFRRTDDGPYRMSLHADAARRVVAAVHAVFAQPCVAGGVARFTGDGAAVGESGGGVSGGAYSYLTHLHLSARHLRRHLQD